MVEPRDDLKHDVRAAIASLTAPWTVEQVAAEVGDPPDDVRVCVSRMIEGGTIEDLGDDPRHEGEGPAPRLYGPPALEDALTDKDVRLG
jgi:hypothetical protein